MEGEKEAGLRGTSNQSAQVPDLAMLTWGPTLQGFSMTFCLIWFDLCCFHLNPPNY